MLEALHSNEAYRRYYKENQLEDASEQCSGLRVVLVRVEKASGQSLIVFGLEIVNTLTASRLYPKLWRKAYCRNLVYCGKLLNIDQCRTKGRKGPKVFGDVVTTLRMVLDS